MAREGTAMSNPLSPFLTSLFMSSFEKEMNRKMLYFPEIWIKYVDDIYAVLDTTKPDIECFGFC